MKSTLCEPSFREAIMRALLHACVAVLAIAAAMPSLSWAQTPAPSITKEMAALFQRASNDILDVAEAMPAEKYGYKPAAEMSTFSDQLVHVAGIVQRFVDTSKGVKTEAAHHGAMGKPEVIALLKKTFQSGQDSVAQLSDAQLLETVKFPFGDRMVTRYTYWQGPLYQIRNHHGQLVVYLRMNGIVPPTTARR
ncbi:MAG: hypothetical protein DMD85_17665 [Candidatus Rokuibacteriota bacterium]|nr:MAG: hypothetical protein DMD85_17665 [Candidatus Rokubacteria bacterium]